MLNKRECRKFSYPDTPANTNSGVFHAQQVSYVIRTAVKNISHHRTLILYIYDCKQAVAGDCTPLWVMFQTKDDFLTLAQKEDGSTAWRTASFDHLDRSVYYDNKQYAFYSARDEKRVQHYFKADTDGFRALTAAQDAILSRRQRQRRITKEKAIAARMAGIPALPRGLRSWIKSIMPAYFFYNYKRGSKDVQGICSACGHEVTLPGIKQKNKAVCPHCKHSLIAKPRSRRGRYMYDRDTFEVIQNMPDGRLVIRIIKAYFSYKNDIPDIEIYENARQFLWQDDGKLYTEHYYYSHSSGIITKWRKGIRPEYIMYQYQYEAGTCGYLYTRNLQEALSGTAWQYCTIADFYNHYNEPMQALPFLMAHIKHSRLEHLCKVGFFNLVSDLAYHGSGNLLDESKNRTHQILKVAAEDVDFLRNLDVDTALLKTFQKYAGIKDRQQLLMWQLENNIQHNILPILKHITVHKLIRYAEKQFLLLHQRKNEYGSICFTKMQDIVTEYRDYLDMCEKLNYDMKNSFVLYPKDLQKAHDRVQKRIKIKENAQLQQDFKIAAQDAKKRYAYESDGMKIVVPATPGDLATEGNALHHCVGRGQYTNSVAKKKCIILFIRRCSDESKPFFTMEIRGKEIIQVQGIGSCVPTEEVQRFLDLFKQQVLQNPINTAA